MVKIVVMVGSATEFGSSLKIRRLADINLNALKAAWSEICAV